MVALSERTRHRTHAVRVGKVTLGGGAPVVVQSMTNTDTADVTATTRQVIATYRGRPSEVTMPAVELEVRAGMATIRSVLQTLRDVEDVRVRPLT